MAKKQNKCCISTLMGIGALLVASINAQAFESMKMGDWDVDISGNINAFFTNLDCDANGNGVVSSGLACGSLTGSNYDSGNVQTGLLPSWFGFHAKQEGEGLTTEINIGFQPGVDGGGGAIDTGLALNSENLRQVNLKFGSDWGTLTFGRDLGLYGSDAILSDMTLLGVGTVSDLAAFGGNTTLGRIGVGYLYADWKAQIQYASKDFNGLSFNVALVDPWGAVNLSGLSLDQGSFSQDSDTYGIEGKVGYTWGGEESTTSGKVWASFISQSIDSSDSSFSNQDATGFDVGGKVVFGGLELVGYFYSGEGIGTLGFLWDALDESGATRDSDGFYVQGTYKLPGSGTKLGVSFGESNLDLGSGDTAVGGPCATVTAATCTLVETNESVIFGVYHPLTSSLNLVFEYARTESTAHNGNSAEEGMFAIGAILFY
ncbi:MAG: porin [Gammaproteobacteria bacterium]|nr:porin [Gammaproteobacteria bacterium]MDH3410339.1 porin [Gammaproteobacteria bacterium]